MSAESVLQPGEASSGLSWEALANIYPHAFQRVARMVHRAIDSPETAEDITQEVFILALRYAHTFQGDTSEHKVMSWLFGITRNTIATRIRRQRPDEPSLQELQESQGWEPESSSDELEHVEAVDTVQWLLREGSFTPRALGVAVLKYVHNVPSTEIGAIVGASRTNVDVMAHRTRQRMLALLAQANALPSASVGGE